MACVEGLRNPETKKFVEEMVREYDRRRRYMVERINKIPGFRAKMPKGAFYVFANVKELGLKSMDLAEYILKEVAVATVPGSAFGPSGEGYLRFCYATSLKNIEEGLNRVERAVEKLRASSRTQGP
jgi:aspartate/methionine/tyrosine aminotransferase